MKFHIPVCVTLCLNIFLGFAASYSQEVNESKESANREGIAFFETKIRPVLVMHCYQCHSKEAGKTRGGLRLDTSDGLLRGGESGISIVVGDPDKSLLYKAIKYDHKDLRMPPKGRLPRQVVADFRAWIAMGAPVPNESVAKVIRESEVDYEKGRLFWAYQTPKMRPLPEVKNKSWPLNNVDRFVLARLEKEDLVPVADAAPHKLVRRLYFTIIGMPPTANEAQHWTQLLSKSESSTERQNIIARLADQLLASPRFGEHWGRHWLDVARFAESTGGDANNIMPHAWRYRDYVIDAFNSDKPFDRFIREQIAGDLLPISDDQEWAKNVIATGFLAIGVKLVGEEDDRKYFADLVDEQIDTTTRAFLGTTMACARCHDHKFDPISQQDYFALAGIFRSTQTHYGLIKAQARQTTPLLDLTGMGIPSIQKRISSAQLSRLKAERDTALEKFNAVMKKIRSKEHVQRSVLLRSRTVRDRTEVALQMYDDSGNPRILAMGVQDREYPMKTWLLHRGDIDKPGQLVERGFPTVLNTKGNNKLNRDAIGSGRLELANWLASGENPLTARVITNRVWHYLFGQGIVKSVDDFGKSGSMPSHPELLDYLSLRLIEKGWSIKALIREIVLSRTWQLSTERIPENFARDPDNRLLWRMNQRRIEAESIRDSMLYISGNLIKDRPPGTFLHSVGEGTIGRSVYEPEIRKIKSNHRSVYLPRVRNVLPESLELFDAPDGSLVVGARETTTTPLQALYLMNNPFVFEQANALVNRLQTVKEIEWVDTAYLSVFGRSPTDKEKEITQSFFERFRTLAKQNGMEDDANRTAQVVFCQSLLCTAEFQILD